MRRKILASFTTLTALLGTAMARMGASDSWSGSKGGSVGLNMASNVEFTSFELEGDVKDLLWCGSNDEIVLMQTTEGVVYRSRDRGGTWKKLQGLLIKQGMQVKDDEQQVRQGIPLIHFVSDRQSSQNHAEPSRRLTRSPHR